MRKVYLKYGQITSRKCLILSIRELYQKKRSILDHSMTLEIPLYKNSHHRRKVEELQGTK